MTIKSAESVDPIVQRLRALVRESPDLEDVAGIYGAILPLLRDADPIMAGPRISRDQARAKMGKGVPLLHDLDIEFDTGALVALMRRMARALETTGRKRGRPTWARAFHRRDSARLAEEKRMAAARGIRLALEEHALDLNTLMPQVSGGAQGSVMATAKGFGLDPGLLRTLAQNALKPALRAWAGQLTPMVEGVPWQSGICFICGASATLGELQGNDQEKHLRCGQCGADWIFHRLRCVHCGNENHTTLGCLSPEGRQERMRIETCERCKGYLKVTSSFTPVPPEMITVEDLATLQLDFIAQERGYTREPVTP